MKRLCLVAEGQTEVEFVRACLEPHLRDHGLLVYPSILQARSGRHRGGRVTIERLAKHLAREYHQADRVTTLVDFYRFQDRGEGSCEQLEAAILAETLKWGGERLQPRFVRPYVQMHEFEALLFSDIEQFRWVLDGWDEQVRERLRAVRSAYGTPEEINDGAETAPSKRLLEAFPPGTYNKTVHGPIIAAETGLAPIRAACPRFNEWLRGLEQWGADPA